MRYFTVQEANGFIPALQSTFGYIRKLREQVTHLVTELEQAGAIFEEAGADGEGPLTLTEDTRNKRERVVVALAEIKRMVRELESHGLIVKRLDGSVDFRSLRGTRPVYLSWRKGESRVDHWHETWSDDDRQEVERREVDQLFPKPLPN